MYASFIKIISSVIGKKINRLPRRIVHSIETKYNHIHEYERKIDFFMLSCMLIHVKSRHVYKNNVNVVKILM